MEKHTEEAGEKKENLATEILNHLVTQNKRIFLVLMVTLFMLFASNLAWLWAFQSYDYESYDVKSEDGGNANYIGNDGDINNGKSESVPEEKTKRSKIQGNENKEEKEVNGN